MKAVDAGLCPSCRRWQLVADLTAAFALIQQKYAPEYPSMLIFIIGPGSTVDIAILVLGAPGPKKLMLFVLKSPAGLLLLLL